MLKKKKKSDFVALMVRVPQGKRERLQSVASHATPRVSVNKLVNRFIDRGLKEKERAR
jgi:hypothetical protein